MPCLAMSAAKTFYWCARGRISSPSTRIAAIIMGHGGGIGGRRGYPLPLASRLFDLRTGEAARSPALNPLTVWQVEHDGVRIFVRQKRAHPKPRSKGPIDTPGKIAVPSLFADHAEHAEGRGMTRNSRGH
jgi:hypothetical protein